VTEHEHDVKSVAWQYVEVGTVRDVIGLGTAVPLDAELMIHCEHDGDEHQLNVAWYGWADGCELDHRTGRAFRNEANGT
jgi:hypothetical protein